MRSLTILGLLLLVSGCASTTDDPSAASADLVSTDAGSADGNPVRNACVSSFGSGLSGTSGRLDGTIVAVVAPGTNRQCNGDRTHVHLQVLSGGSVYDVAVNVDGGFMAEKDVALPGGAWAEGWHKGSSLSYPNDLGLHSADFQTGSLSQIDQKFEAALATANHVSVFGTLYSHGGLHLIHRSKSGGSDGAVVTNPLSPAARVFAFHFSSQSF